MSCGFFRGKRSRRMFEVKGDSMNVHSNVGIGGAKRRWGSREKASISRVFILEAGGDDVAGFKVDAVRGTGEFGDGS
jgi:hypothetical protein